MSRKKHDCSACVFLGVFDQYDLYWCKSFDRTLDAVIARYGDEPQEYRSFHPPKAFAFPVPARNWYVEALKRAQKAGLYDPKTQGWVRTLKCLNCEHSWTLSFPFGAKSEVSFGCPRCGSHKTTCLES
jgi:hypothetical protein